MKRNERTEKFKDFLRKEEELNNNWKAQRALGYKPLDKPIHHGYDAYWVLRDDVARRADADKFQYILDNYGQSVWCRKKDFKSWNSQLKRETDVNPTLREIDSYRYDKLSPWVQKFFYSYQKQNRWGGQSHTMYSVNIPRHFLVRKVVKSYKTHYKVLDEILKQEEAEIDAALDTTFYDERNKYWNRHHSKKRDRQISNRANRHHNKQALNKNMSMVFEKGDGDYGCWLSDWCDEFKEFTYNHRHSGKWYWW